jgi:hypothetical protein
MIQNVAVDATHRTRTSSRTITIWERRAIRRPVSPARRPAVSPIRFSRSPTRRPADPPIRFPWPLGLRVAKRGTKKLDYIDRSEFIMAVVKTLLVLIAACGLLLASQRPAQAQVSWGIPLPFPFLFYNFNQGYYSQPYYGQRAYYNRSYYCRPGDCTPSRNAYFYRPYYRPRYYYGPAWQPGYYYGPRWGGYGGW